MSLQIRHQEKKFFFPKLKERMQIVGALVVVLLLVLLAGYFDYLRLARNYPPSFHGKIVEKWFSTDETQTGSIITRKLLLEDENGVCFSVTVDEKTFNQAEIGNQIEKKNYIVRISAY